MGIAINPPFRLQDQQDVTAPTGAEDGQFLVWDDAGGAFTWQAVSAGVTDHGALTGLADDDHSIYLLADGTRAMTGNLNMAGGYIASLDAWRADVTGATRIDYYSNVAGWEVYTGSTKRVYIGQNGVQTFLTAGATAAQIGGHASDTIFYAGLATRIPAIVRGAAAQTANLMEWQDSASTVLASMSAAGALNLKEGSAAAPAITLGVAATKVGVWNAGGELYLGTGGSTATRISGSTTRTMGPLQMWGTLQTAGATANTNTPSGATAYQHPIYNTSGTLLGYIPIYASAW